MTEETTNQPPAFLDRRVTDKGLGGTVMTMHERLNRGDERMGKIEKDLAANSAATNEVLEIVRMGKSFFKVAGYIGSGFGWLLAAGAAIAAIWGTWRSPH